MGHRAPDDGPRTASTSPPPASCLAPHIGATAAGGAAASHGRPIKKAAVASAVAASAVAGPPADAPHADRDVPHAAVTRPTALSPPSTSPGLDGHGPETVPLTMLPTDARMAGVAPPAAAAAAAAATADDVNDGHDAMADDAAARSPHVDHGAGDANGTDDFDAAAWAMQSPELAHHDPWWPQEHHAAAGLMTTSPSPMSVSSPSVPPLPRAASSSHRPGSVAVDDAGGAASATTAPAPAVPPLTALGVPRDALRVKLYQHVSNNQWATQGTGYVSCPWDASEGAFCLVVHEDMAAPASSDPEPEFGNDMTSDRASPDARSPRSPSSPASPPPPPADLDAQDTPMEAVPPRPPPPPPPLDASTGGRRSDQPSAPAADAAPRVLLRGPIHTDHVYYRQEETLIVWQDRDGRDLALSFQEPAGCHAVLVAIEEARQRDTALSGAPDPAAARSRGAAQLSRCRRRRPHQRSRLHRPRQDREDADSDESRGGDDADDGAPYGVDYTDNGGGNSDDNADDDDVEVSLRARIGDDDDDDDEDAMHDGPSDGTIHDHFRDDEDDVADEEDDNDGGGDDAGHGDDDDLTKYQHELQWQFQLKDPMMADLAEIETQITDCLNSVGLNREYLAQWVFQNHYVQRLIPLHREAELQGDMPKLYCMGAIMRAILFLNSRIMIDLILSDEATFYGVIGLLEYDRDAPGQKAGFREHLQSHARFRQILPIAQPGIAHRITQVYCMTYLKDVVLARLLDDTTFTRLSNTISLNQMDILTHFLGPSSTYLRDVLALFSMETAPAPTIQTPGDAHVDGNDAASIASPATARDTQPPASPSPTFLPLPKPAPAHDGGLDGCDATERPDAVPLAPFSQSPPPNVPPAAWTTEERAVKCAEAVLFLHELAAIMKGLNPLGRQHAYRQLAALGLTDVLTRTYLRHADARVRLAACSLLSQLLDHHPMRVRAWVVEQLQQASTSASTSTSHQRSESISAEPTPAEAAKPTAFPSSTESDMTVSPASPTMMTTAAAAHHQNLEDGSPAHRITAPSPPQTSGAEPGHETVVGILIEAMNDPTDLGVSHLAADILQRLLEAFMLEAAEAAALFAQHLDAEAESEAEAEAEAEAQAEVEAQVQAQAAVETDREAGADARIAHPEQSTPDVEMMREAVATDPLPEIDANVVPGGTAAGATSPMMADAEEETVSPESALPAEPCLDPGDPARGGSTPPSETADGATPSARPGAATAATTTASLMAAMASNAETFMSIFYVQYATRLLEPLRALRSSPYYASRSAARHAPTPYFVPAPSYAGEPLCASYRLCLSRPQVHACAQLCDFLVFAVRMHPARARVLLTTPVRRHPDSRRPRCDAGAATTTTTTTTSAVPDIVRLLFARDTYLVCSALRVIKALFEARHPAYHVALVSAGVPRILAGLLYIFGRRGNLAVSTGLSILQGVVQEGPPELLAAFAGHLAGDDDEATAALERQQLAALLPPAVTDAPKPDTATRSDLLGRDAAARYVPTRVLLDRVAPFEPVVAALLDCHRVMTSGPLDHDGDPDSMMRLQEASSMSTAIIDPLSGSESGSGSGSGSRTLSLPASDAATTDPACPDPGLKGHRLDDDLDMFADEDHLPAAPSASTRKPVLADGTLHHSPTPVPAEPDDADAAMTIDGEGVSDPAPAAAAKVTPPPAAVRAASAVCPPDRGADDPAPALKRQKTDVLIAPI
ncbi:hypothetical protein CXG81DRAFT_26998 [Caulochytrium protostelioides]|uniref:Uncharacterized protein n=1 Tax=Caulochytrium protostelioides TaxID=1555241 RepID=A0A4P9X591_9FUNG|nr:hypothetical protein CXG81DRAFT_26998 [Caulochytrium protostelioides]|eukprot:RKP00274.1 hypothetical protein CXG81DRAFT_26998 [Caulochytrium protostelioides]